MIKPCFMPKKTIAHGWSRYIFLNYLKADLNKGFHHDYSIAFTTTQLQQPK